MGGKGWVSWALGGVEIGYPWWLPHGFGGAFRLKMVLSRGPYTMGQYAIYQYRHGHTTGNCIVRASREYSAETRAVDSE